MSALSPICHPERSESSAKRMIRGVEGPCVFALMRSKFSVALDLALATLREIFDESAYERFLTRHHLTPSTATYADFRAEHETTKVHRPRCC